MHSPPGINKIIIALVSCETPTLMKGVGLILLVLKYEQLVVITAVFQIKDCAGNYLIIEKHCKIQTSAA